MDLYPEAKHKRGMAKTIGSFDPKQAGEWLGSAVAQEAGRLDEYRAAVKAWEAQKPHPMDFATPEGRAEVEAALAGWHAKAKADFESMWGKTFEQMTEGVEPNEDGSYTVPVWKRAE